MTFLRNLLAVLVGLSIFSLFGLIVLLGIAGAGAAADQPVIKDHSVLSIPLKGTIRERVVDNPFTEFFEEDVAADIDLHQLLLAIDGATTDERIKAMYLASGYLSGGFSSLWEIREALLNFKESGKKIYAYGNSINEGSYYVTSVADYIFVEPEGLIEFNGLSINATFFKKTFEKLDIKPVIFRVGEYKSAVEPFIRESLSQENREQLNSLVQDTYSNILQDISNSLSISVKELQSISDNMLAFMPEDAMKLGLITSVEYEDSLRMVLKQHVGTKPSYISFPDYAQVVSTDMRSNAENEIAVVIADGQIMMSGQDNLTPSKLKKELSQIRKEKSVKAVVIRINSPGGDLTASDLLWKEIKKTAEVKPVIASMGDMAASGGYYMASACDSIVAAPSTITGSIGIFGLWFNLENFFGSKLGITFDVVKTGEYSDIMSVTRSLQDGEKQLIQKRLDRGYDTFLNKVVEGRRMSKGEVDKVARGRVWTGGQANGKGLVDAVGGIDQAIELAANAAGIVDYNVTHYPKRKNFFEEIIDMMSGKLDAKLHSNTPVELIKQIEKIEELSQWQGAQARWPFEVAF